MLGRRLAVVGLLFSLVGYACAEQEESSKVRLSTKPAQQYEVFAPYWTLEPGWHSELMLRNNSIAREISVTPILRLSTGQEVTLETVSLKPDETRTIDIADSKVITNAGLAHRAGSYGSVVFRYSAQSSGNIYASVMIHMSERPIMFHYDAFPQASDYPIDGYEGIWWLPESTTQSQLVISNVLTHPLKGAVSISDPAGKSYKVSLALPPRQTTRFDLRALVQQASFSGASGGVSVRFNSEAGAAQVALINFDEDTASSALMRLFPHELASDRATTEITLRAPTVALANPDPALSLPEGTRLQSQVFLRNTTSSPLDVKVLVDWRSATGWDRKSVDFPPINAKATALLDLSELQSQNAIPSYANWATVTLSYSGRDGDLIPISASYADHQRYLMQSPFSDWLSYQWKGGEWEVDANHNSLITTGNAGTSPTRAAVTIYYAQGSQKYQLAPRTLKPGEAMTVNVAELIRTQVPDASGVVLPVGLSSGSYEIRDLDSDVGQLYEGKISIDLTNGRAFYGCALCCSYDIPYITSFDGEVGDTGYVQVLAFNSCSSTEDDKTSITTGWGTDDLGIATAAAGGIIHATGSGSTFSRGSVTLRTPQSYKVCPLAGLTPQGVVDSSPKITGLTPSRGLIGTSVPVIISGAGFATTGVSVSAGTGISVAVTSSTSERIEANFTVAANAPAGKHSVSVTVAGKTSNSKDFFVQVPTSLSVVSVTLADPNCPGSANYGLFVDVTYQTWDQDSPRVQIQASGMVPWETGTFFTGSPVDGPVGNSSASDGTFHDTPIGVCSPYPISNPGLTANQTISMRVGANSYPVRTQTLTVNAPGSESFGHGTMTNSLGDINKSR